MNFPLIYDIPPFSNPNALIYDNTNEQQAFWVHLLIPFLCPHEHTPAPQPQLDTHLQSTFGCVNTKLTPLRGQTLLQGIIFL